MSESRNDNGRDSQGRIIFQNREKELPEIEFPKKRKNTTVRRKNPNELIIRRAKVAQALRPYLDKFVGLTLMTEGNKRKKGWFLVLRFGFQSVVLIEMQGKFDKQETMQEGKESVVPLEKVYYIFDGQKGIWPQRQSSVYAWHSK